MYITAPLHILQAILLFTPKRVQDLFGNGYGLLVALFVIVLAVGILGLATYRLVSGRIERRKQLRSGRQAYERLSRRV